MSWPSGVDVESGFISGVVLTAFGSVGMALIAVSLKRIKNCHYILVQFHYGWSATAISLLAMSTQSILNGHWPFSNVLWSTLLKLMGASMFNFFSQNIITIANQQGNPATVGLITYCQLFYNYLADVLLFSSVFSPLQNLGMILCVGFSLLASGIKLAQESKLI
jgi:drug/metabolite transporter (DMT)-like permease